MQIAYQAIDNWVTEQIAPWRGTQVSQAKMLALESARPEIFMFSFINGEVHLQSKVHSPPGKWHAHRARMYLQLLTEAHNLYCPDRNFKIALCCEDYMHAEVDVPVFTFQKIRGSRSILLPDIDFLRYDFYVDSQWDDQVSLERKINSAIFIGSTSGGGIITVDKLKQNSVPRIGAALYFKNNPRITFQLPSVCQFQNEQVRNMILGMELGTERVPWREQFKSLFLISMDGNGATCSRVVVSLKSNSVLLKYNSNHVLYYFSGLVPNKHYIPISRDEDVETVLDHFNQDQGYFFQIARVSSEFYNELLTRDKVVRYAGLLLRSYADLYKSWDMP